MRITRGPGRKVGIGEETLTGQDGTDRNVAREVTVLSQVCHGDMTQHHKHC